MFEKVIAHVEAQGLAVKCGVDLKGPKKNWSRRPRGTICGHKET